MAEDLPRADPTELLRRLSAGDRDAAEPLVTLVYDELRAIAERHLARERADHTLQPTALLHEAWLRIAQSPGDIPSRGHFFALASRVMRSLLVDHARRKKADKRGGGRERIALEESVESQAPSLDVLALDDALTRLESVDAELARIVELRYFGGSSVPETAEAVGLPLRTVERRLRAATAWLRRELDEVG